MPKWLKDANFYEIYPQSFYDSNGDGIGDINGMSEKLDYIKELGCNAIWINPCFDSPFVDAGYDVKDYYKVAPRYGTNEDLRRFFAKAHEKGMHVILDLVAGHTSSESKWFKESCKPERNEYSDRYVWTNTVWNAPMGVGSIMGWLRGGYDRDGAAALNFFTAQPALNYGFYNKDEGCDWEMDPSEDGPRSTCKALEDVMRFWLDMGCDGFRVDMAGSLVKNDPDGLGTIAVWNDIFSRIKAEYPESAFVSEWGDAARALKAGFDMDFVLHFGPSHYLDLFRENPYFSKEGTGSAKQFFDIYLNNLKNANGGYICIPSGNHDMARYPLTLPTLEEQKIMFAFLYTMPGVPFIYYGDEIGMRFVEGLTSKEGGYYRTGARTPMQWDTSTNAGFSSAPKEDLYLPVDSEYKSINVETEKNDENSLYHEVKKLIALRKEHTALGNDGAIDVKQYDGYPLVYQRKSEDETITVIINPSQSPATVDEEYTGEILYAYNTEKIENHTITPQSVIMIKA